MFTLATHGKPHSPLRAPILDTAFHLVKRRPQHRLRLAFYQHIGWPFQSLPCALADFARWFLCSVETNAKHNSVIQHTNAFAWRNRPGRLAAIGSPWSAGQSQRWWAYHGTIHRRHDDTVPPAWLRRVIRVIAAQGQKEEPRRRVPSFRQPWGL